MKTESDQYIDEHEEIALSLNIQSSLLDCYWLVSCKGIKTEENTLTRWLKKNN